MKKSVSRVTCRVSVTRNESPGCLSDRSRTGLAFNVRGIPDSLDGARVRAVHSVDGRRLVLSPDSVPVDGPSSMVTIKRGHVQINVKDATGLDRTVPGSPVECGLSVVALGTDSIDDVTVAVIDLTAIYDGPRGRAVEAMAREIKRLIKEGVRTCR